MLSRQPRLNFFSFVTLEDPSVYREYNMWHQLDHLPENRALPGVIWGDRWALTEEFRAHARGVHRMIDSVAMYWFDEPADVSVAEWTQLGEDTFQWGRGPLLPGVRRDLLAFFKPVKGYTTPQATVGAEALPMRPHTGVHITVTQFDDAHSAETHDAHRHEDLDIIPALLSEDGAIGAWTFTFDHVQRHDSLPFEETPEAERGSMRIRVLFLEGDPLEVTARLEAVESTVNPHPVGTLLLAAPLKTIIPWQDW